MVKLVNGLHPRCPKVVKLVHGLYQEGPKVVELEVGLHHGCPDSDYRNLGVVKLVMELHYGVRYLVLEAGFQLIMFAS